MVFNIRNHKKPLSKKWQSWNWFVLLILSVSFGGCTEWKGEVWVVNQSSRLIVRTQVKVCGQTLTFGELAPGKSQSASFIVGGDSHYSVLVETVERPPLAQDLGYVTRDFDYIDYLVVTNEEVLLNPEGFDRKVLGGPLHCHISCPRSWISL